MPEPWERFQSPRSAAPAEGEGGRPWERFQSEPISSAEGAETAFPRLEREMVPRRSVGNILGSAVMNLPKSAAQFGHDVAQPFLHPIDTGQNLANIGRGVIQKLGLQAPNIRGLGMVDPTQRPEGEQRDYTPYADAVGRFLVQRYGSMEAIENTLATDPVGLAADLSMVLSGGGGIAARAPGIAGRAGEAARAVGRAIDPITAAGHAVSGAARLGTHIVGGLGTHTGPAPLRTAFEAGREGGEAGERFRSSMRDPAQMDQVVYEAVNALGQIRKERGQEYVRGMQEVGRSREIIPFDRVDRALADITGVQTFHGQVLDEATQAVRQRIGQEVAAWRRLDPQIFHTAEGFDALKKRINNLFPHATAPAGTPERLAVDAATRAIRETIIQEAPVYARVMKGYEEASTIIRELEHELSLGRTGRGGNLKINTALRKLQTVMRDNVNTSFGNRRVLAQYLVDAGAPHLMEALAGQALNTVTPRGLGKLLGGEILAAGGGLLGAGAMGSAAGLSVLGALPFMSPRLMGEVYHGAGRAAGVLPEGTGAAIRGAERAGHVLGSPLAPGNL